MEGQHGTQGGGRAGKNGSPRLNLPQARAHKRFKLGELFDSCVGNADIQKRDLSKTGHLVVSSGIANSGVVGRTHKQARLITKPCLTIDMFGNVFAREIPFVMVTHARVFAVIPKDRSWSFRPLVYVAALLQYFNTIYSFSSMATWGCVRDVEITLPVCADGKIDFAYMEAYIRKLEAARLRELEKYLAAAGFNDCKLTKAERTAVEDFTNGNVPVRTFKIADLFSVDTPRRRFNANAVKFGGVHPYVVRTSQNNGQRETIIADEKWLNPGNTISFGQDTATIFYQPKDYFTGDKIKVMKSLRGPFNERIACFCLATMRKAFSTFAWGRSSFNEKVLKEVEVSLPITTGGEIDYVFIETFIRGMMKRAISGVIAWKDKEIAATKSVIGK